MKNKNVLIYNFGQHYRKPIFKKMDVEMGFDFYFGDNVGDIKTFDYEELDGFKGILKSKPIYSHIYWQKGLLRLAFKNYDNYVILGEYFCLSHWFLFLLLKIRRKKIIIWTHGWYGNEGLLKRILKKVYFLFADKILLYGNYAKELMLTEGIKKEKLELIYNSLDFETQDKIYQGLTKTDIYTSHFENQNRTIFYIGRLQKRKKIEQVLYAIQKLQKKDIYVNFVIVGIGEVEEELRQIIKTLKLDKNVWFYGATYSEEEISELLYNADVCVSPGNVGLTAMHSLAYGTPVITHSNFKKQVPEFEAITAGVSGDFFEENSIDDLIKKIDNWTTKRCFRSHLKEDCRKIIIEKYNPNYQISLLKRIIRELNEK